MQSVSLWLGITFVLIGATNVWRTAGPKAGALTFALDAAKGFLAVWLAGVLSGGSELWMSLAALAVLVGHAYSIFLGFKGGKAVASFVGGQVGVRFARRISDRALRLGIVVFGVAVAAWLFARL